MADHTNFPEGVSDKLMNYVYRLIDPRNGSTFYVGQGVGDRVFHHANAEFDRIIVEPHEDSLAADDEISLKASIIREIKDAHLEVQYVIHRHGMSLDVAFEVEAALIDAYQGLSNVQSGHGSGSRGPMHVDEIIDRFQLPAVEHEPTDSLLLINVNALQDRSNRKQVYEQVRFAWRIDSKRASAADYILAVVRGVVVGAFVADKWLEATAENFPDRIAKNDAIVGRYGFIGHEAPKSIWEKYVGDRGKWIENPSLQPRRNPIRYWTPAR